MDNIGEYKIEKLIHEGEKNYIYKVRDESGKEYVLKVLKKEYINEENIDKVEIEYRMIKKVDEKYTAKAYKIVTEEDVYIKLEYIDGMQLKSFIAKEGMEIPEFLRLAYKMVKALKEVHRAGIIHKDINPYNVLVSKDERSIRIIDFNISEYSNIKKQPFSSLNILQGTIPYISPEQTGRMNRVTDYRTDFYSLGITFYEMLTGRLPFETDNKLEMIHSHIAKKAISPIKVKEDIPEVLSNMVMKLMEKDADDRYKSAEGIFKDIEKCIDMLEEQGYIDVFELGKLDFYKKLKISQKIYGREEEIDKIFADYIETARGGFKKIFISGYSGVGKTTIVKELYKPVTSSGGYFISGKFEKFKRDIPYAALVEALEYLIDMIMSESDEVVEKWRRDILKSVQDLGAVLTELVPKFENIIGIQPEVPKLKGIEAHNRFERVIKKFLKDVSNNGHPMVIFLDDLQWADSASIRLLKEIMYDNEISYMCLIGAFRDNEVFASSSLNILIEELKLDEIPFTSLKIKNLKYEDILNMIKDTFLNIKDSEELAQIVFKKTGGNAFFAKQILEKLYFKEYVYFDQQNYYWTYDLSKIEQLGISKNVVEFVAERLKTLDENILSIMKFAACLGSTFSAIEIAKIARRKYQDVLEMIYTAAKENLIIPVGKDKYVFSHDNIQQAFYSIIKDDERERIHFDIGKHLLAVNPDYIQKEAIFEITGHMNDATELMIRYNQKDELARLNMMAGRKAKDSVAYRLSMSYYKKVLNIMTEEDWDQNYEILIEAHNGIIEASYMTKEYEEMEKSIKEIKKRAKTKLDKSIAYDMEIQSYMSRNMHAKGVETTLEVIKIYGIDIPQKPTEEDTNQAFKTVMELTNERNSEWFLSLPNMVDEEKQIVMGMLSSVIPITFNAAPELLPLVVCKMIELSINYGNSKYSPFAYSLYGLLMCGVVGDIDTGSFYGDLAVELVNMLGAETEVAKTYNMVALHVMHYKKHVKEVVKTADMAFKKGIDTGDYVFAGFAGHGYCFNYYLAGNELSKVNEVFNSYTQALIDIGQGTQTRFQNIWHQAVLNLRDPEKEPWMLIGKKFDEEKELSLMIKEGHRTALLVTYFHKTMLSYIYKNHRKALEYTNETSKYLDGGIGLIVIPMHYMLDSLSRLMYMREEGVDERNMKKVLENKEKLKALKEACKQNYEHRYKIIEAEIYRNEKNYEKARKRYEEAITLAHKNGYIYEEAMFREMISDLYDEYSKEELKNYYLDRAYMCYKKWGANYKANTIKTAKEKQQDGNINKSVVTVNTWSTTKNLNDEIDLSSILKMSQIMSKEIVYEELLKKILEIFVQNAGAERAIIMNFISDKEIVVAESLVDEELNIIWGNKKEDFKKVPHSVFNYVINSKKAVLLDSAYSDSLFAEDVYIEEKQLKSLLCFPIISRSEVKSILYIENNVSEGAFSKNRIDILNMLSSQISIAFENAMMYRHMERLVAKRTLELEEKNKELENLNQRLTKMSVTDNLTKLYNRRKLDEIIDTEIERSNRYGNVFSVVILDIDKFKYVNDNFGHDKGDKVLVELSLILRKNVRKVDTVGRWGGEEFLIVSPNTDTQQAFEIAEKIRKVIEKHDFGFGHQITSSFGVAMFKRDDDFSKVLKRADDNLYKAKKNGRNRVIY